MRIKRNNLQKLICILTILLLSLGCFVGTVHASEVKETENLSTQKQTADDAEAGQEVQQISDASDISKPAQGIATASDLLEIAKNPNGSFVLTADIDMSGVAWKPFAFFGILDGNGYSVLNLTVTETGDSVKETYDGNMKVYDTYFAGLFDVLGGRIINLNLVNIRVNVETDQPCFIGSFAGYMEDAVLENCSTHGILQLKAHDRMFGVGGMIGYGYGTILNCRTDVTLVCIDTDATTRDEQFMGGVCAAGYPEVEGCEIEIRGYDSDHGYVHDGGLIGMYMFYPKGTKHKGEITDNRVTGKITFFEDNKNRRAYCNGFIGEIMNWDFTNRGNKDDFVRDEVFEYDVDLVPHACDNPVMREEVIVPGCEFSYVKYTCETCGYEETDHYTLKVHDYEWTVEKEATFTEEGLSRGICKNCGAQETEIIPLRTPEPTPEPSPEITEKPNDPFALDADAKDKSDAGKDQTQTGSEQEIAKRMTVTMIVLILAVSAVTGAVIFVKRRK